ncbi:hypothetical protein [Bacillus sp. FJAT-45037]|uniref:hypothetical protein n=1 Tax=Bacillus sp. FJAT-45037 TaxID=2011007 RepID=UPI000C24B0B9|nr:hypothetical protein [Bacillus sp. FJAT-45037]
MNKLREDLVYETFGLSELPKDFYEREVIITKDDITYITGYSGSGKSYLLNLFLNHTNATTLKEPVNKSTAIINIIGQSFTDAINLLSQVGLSEAYIYLKNYTELSDGQKFRFKLAKALESNPAIIVVDEFLTNLDRLTAKVVAYNLQKICRRKKIKLVVATPHDDLVSSLSPGQLIILDLNGTYKNIINKNPLPKLDFIEELTLAEGDYSHYLSLKKYHYFPDASYSKYDPKYYIIKNKNDVLGVSVFIRPYSDKWNNITLFKEVNELLRVNARIIVHPAYRGIGLTKSLLNVQNMELNCTYVESRTALGRFVPFYLSSGFTAIENPTTYKSLTRKELEKSLVNNSNLTLNDSLKIKELALEILLSEYYYYRDVVNLPKLSNEDSSLLENIFNSIVMKMKIEDLLEQTKYFPMASFVIKKQAAIN